MQPVPPEHQLVEVPNGVLDVWVGGPMAPGAPVVCAAHPGGVFGESAVDLLRETAEARAVSVNPRGIGASSAVPSGSSYTLDSMVDDLDAVRRHFGVETWVFWGMSGGGWLGLAYACKYPQALAGVILESVCSCFRVRLADSACILSPFHPSWAATLSKHGLIDRDAHLEAGDPTTTEWLEVDGVGAVFRRRDGPALLVSPMPVAAEMRAAMPLCWTVDFRESLPDIRTPALVIAGSDDPIVPLSHVRSLHEGIAGSRLLIVDGAGHVPTTARRGEVTDAVRSFLGGRAR
jgi:pimeloyl-ACP methyl ester carboxylesterase